jgi:hypothetical protein
VVLKDSQGIATGKPKIKDPLLHEIAALRLQAVELGHIMASGTDEKRSLRAYIILQTQANHNIVICLK